ncbi:unnamed protein product [Lampetra fluviatilis]
MCAARDHKTRGAKLRFPGQGEDGDEEEEEEGPHSAGSETDHHKCGPAGMRRAARGRARAEARGEQPPPPAPQPRTEPREVLTVCSRGCELRASSGLKFAASRDVTIQPARHRLSPGFRRRFAERDLARSGAFLATCSAVRRVDCDRLSGHRGTRRARGSRRRTTRTRGQLRRMQGRRCLHSRAPSGRATLRRRLEAILREAHARLVELLHVVASLLVETSPTVALVKEGAAMPFVDDDSAAISQQAGNLAAQPMYSAAILSPAWSAQAAKLEDAPSAPMDISALCRRLPFIKEFAVTSCDWVAFKRRFLMNADLAGWTEAEALRASPAALDDDALVAFLAISPLERSTLTQAFDQMASIYEPRTNTRHKFATRRKGEAESALAFRSTLLALAKAAFLKMDHDGIDALVKTLHPILPVEDDDVSSLNVAKCIQAQQLLQRDRAQMVECSRGLCSRIYCPVDDVLYAPVLPPLSPVKTVGGGGGRGEEEVIGGRGGRSRAAQECKHFTRACSEAASACAGGGRASGNRRPGPRTRAAAPAQPERAGALASASSAEANRVDAVTSRRRDFTAKPLGHGPFRPHEPPCSCTACALERCAAAARELLMVLCKRRCKCAGARRKADASGSREGGDGGGMGDGFWGYRGKEGHEVGAAGGVERNTCGRSKRHLGGRG